MAEYIDVEKARAYVETDLKGDPVLQWLGRTMIEKLPKVEHEAKQPCHMCDSAFVNEELNREDDLSYVGREHNCPRCGRPLHRPTGIGNEHYCCYCGQLVTWRRE